MNTQNLRRKKAVTLTELLVVIAIVALLATMAVPVYVNQLQNARRAVATAETNEISKAMQAVAITHGLMVPIHILDNVPDNSSGSVGPSSTRDDFDSASDGAGRFVIDITRELDDQDGGDQWRLDDNGNRAETMREQWQGPFLNPKRVRFVGETATPGSGDVDKDLVVDPWGNPYRVYSERGLLGAGSLPSGPAASGDIVLSLDTLELPSGAGTENGRFDRFAIVSFGPNSVSDFSGNPLDQGDDIYATFSLTPGPESRYQFF